MKMKVNRHTICKAIEMPFDEAVQMQSDLRKKNMMERLWALYMLVSLIVLSFLLLSGSWIPLIIFGGLFGFTVWKHSKKMPIDISVYFGGTGSGKSTIGVAEAEKAKKNGFPVYANYPIEGTYKLDPLKDFGFYDIQPGLAEVDEAGIEYNNRKFKSMPQENIQWLKLHRHYKVRVMIMSQSFEDMDVTFRRLAHRYFLVKPAWYSRKVICAIPIRRSIGIDDNTHQIVDMFKFDPLIFRLFTTQRYYGPKYWPKFDSYDAPELPQKDFQLWSDDASKWDDGDTTATVA